MKKILKYVGLAMIATLVARALGFAREVILAYKFGTTSISDSFIIALAIPDLLINGFGTAIATLYIPLYFKMDKDQNKKSKIGEFNFSVIAILLLIAFVVIVLFYLFPRQFIGAFASGFDKNTAELTIKMTRVMIWSTIPIMLAYFYKAYAQIKKHFALATLLGCVVNTAIIVTLFMASENTVHILSFGALGGNCLYALLLFILAKNNEYESKITYRVFNSDTKQLLVSVLPICFSNLIFEINQIIDKNFASSLDEGSISALNYSTKIINLITAILGTTIASIVFPKVSKLYSEKAEAEEANILLRLNQTMLTALLPLCLLVSLFSKPIITILFGRGSFDDNSISITSECLVFYSLGIIGFNLKSIWIRAFNARFDTRTPAINSAIAVGINLIMNILLVKYLQHRGLALATACASIITDGLLILKYAKKNINFNLSKLVVNTTKQLLALVSFSPCIMIFRNMEVSNIFSIIKALGITVICSVLYIVLLFVLKEDTIITFYNKIRKRRST